MADGDYCNEKLSILSGVNEVIDRTLDLKGIGKAPHHKHKDSCLTLTNEPMKELKASVLVKEMYQKIESNWKNFEGKASRRGSEENWRFKKKNYISDGNSSPEVSLERAIVNVPNEVWPDADGWVNQVPTASGVVDPNSDRSRRIDLVHKCAEKEYEFIELKVNSDTPLYAAMEILKYGLLYLFSREHPESLSHSKEEKELLSAAYIHLIVLAPAAYYVKYNLVWLEEKLNGGLRSFLKDRACGFQMSFKYESMEILLKRTAVDWQEGVGA